jgi:hypothetical protein
MCLHRSRIDTVCTPELDSQLPCTGLTAVMDETLRVSAQIWRKDSAERKTQPQESEASKGMQPSLIVFVIIQLNN